MEVKNITFTCPSCGRSISLYLSMRPSIISLNCPVCEEIIIMDEDGIHLLSEKDELSVESEEISENMASSAESATDSSPISEDDILNLRIALNLYHDVLRFIEQI